MTTCWPPTKRRCWPSRAGQGQARQPRRPSSGVAPGSRSTTRRATTSRSCSPTRPTSRRTCATIYRRVQPQHARGARGVRLRQHHLEARRGGPALPGRAAVRRPQGRRPPDAVDNAAMGTIFEELIRKLNEALKENPGEHSTPRDVRPPQWSTCFSPATGGGCARRASC